MQVFQGFIRYGFNNMFLEMNQEHCYPWDYLTVILDVDVHVES